SSTKICARLRSKSASRAWKRASGRSIQKSWFCSSNPKRASPSRLGEDTAMASSRPQKSMIRFEFANCRRGKVMERASDSRPHKEALGPVELVDARKEHPIVHLLHQKQIDLDEGMALVQGDAISHGEECI